MRLRRRRLLAERRDDGGRLGRRLFLLLAGTTFVVLAVWSLVDLVDAMDALRQAEQQIDEADDAIHDARVGDAERALEQAERLLHEANEELRLSPALVLMRRVPVASDNLRSLDRSIEAAGAVVHGGRQILSTTDELQDESGSLAVELADGAIPASAVDRARTEIGALVVDLIGRSEPSSGMLVLPPIKAVEDRLYDEIQAQEVNLVRLRRGLAILDQLVGIGQPKRTLLAVANTAEMRGAGGMMLNYGILEAENGGVVIDEFGRVSELPVSSPPDPEAIGVPDDLIDLWSRFNISSDWRNATLSGDFTLDAPVLAAMYRSATNLRANNVVQVDPHALAGILSVTGPVEVADLGTVTSENVVDLVLNEAYVRFPDREERSSVLGDVAEATFRALVTGRYPSVSDLATALVDAVDGRHLMMYSDDPTVQASLEAFDATGSLPAPDDGDFMHLTVQNMSGNKLDYYVDTSIEVTGSRPAGEIGELDVSVTVTNAAPVGETEPGYVFGPINDDHTAGTYRAAVSLYTATGTSLEEATGDPFRIEPISTTENGRPVVTYWIDVPAGQSHTVDLTLSLAPTDPDEPYALELVPSPRVRPTTASVDISVGDGRQVDEDVVLDTGWLITADGVLRVAGF